MRTDWIKPTIVGVLIGGVLAAPVIATKSGGNDRVANERQITDHVIKQAGADHDALLARVAALEAELATARRAADDAQQRLAAAAEADRARQVRASRSRRRPQVVHTVDNPVPSGAAAWAAGSFARAVARCESSDVGIHGVDVNGGVAYYGKWQANRDFWLTYGGNPAYLGGSTFPASEAEQDAVAYRGWLDRGWQPWACARIVSRR